MSIRLIPLVHALVGLIAAASLVACAEPRGAQDHGQHHAGQSANTMGPGPGGTSAAHGGMMGGTMAGSHAGCGTMGGQQAGCPGGMQHMDKEAMCTAYRSMRDAPNQQAQQTMMERHMQGMSPEMRQQHMEMMRQQCQ